MTDVLDVAWIAPRHDERATLVGTTGSGKSFLARYLCGRFRSVMAFDPKGMLSWTGYTVVRTIDALLREVNGGRERTIYRPVHEELLDPDAIDAFFQALYTRGETWGYVDEVYGVTEEGRDMPRHYHACLTRGRERGIGLLSATQRPKGIPMVIFSESEWIYTFHLRLDGDRERIEEVTGIERDSIRDLQPQYFYVTASNRDTDARPHHLDVTPERKT